MQNFKRLVGQRVVEIREQRTNDEHVSLSLKFDEGGHLEVYGLLDVEAQDEGRAFIVVKASCSD